MRLVTPEMNYFHADTVSSRREFNEKAYQF